MLKRNRWYIFIVVLVLFTKNNPANAVSATTDVSSPSVNEKEWSLEARFGYNLDDKSISKDKKLQMRQHVDYGFNEWYALRLISAQVDSQNKNLEHDNFKIENRFQIFEKKKSGFDGGFRLTYKHSDGDKLPHTVGLVLLTDIPFADVWKFRTNLSLEHDVGSNSEDGVSMELRNKIYRNITLPFDIVEKSDIGVALLNDFGNLSDHSSYSEQEHVLRPEFGISFKNGMFVNTNVGFGISRNAPDYMFGFYIGRKF